jgi:hypothetical protein
MRQALLRYDQCQAANITVADRGVYFIKSTIYITSERRLQVFDFGSLIKNPIYLGKVQLAVGGLFALRNGNTSTLG